MAELPTRAEREDGAGDAALEPAEPPLEPEHAEVRDSRIDFREPSNGAEQDEVVGVSHKDEPPVDFFPPVVEVVVCPAA